MQKLRIFFTSNKKLNIPSEISFVSIDFKDIEKDENEIIKINSYSKKESFIQKILKKLSPKCHKCKEHSIVSVDYMVHK